MSDREKASSSLEQGFEPSHFPSLINASNMANTLFQNSSSTHPNTQKTTLQTRQWTYWSQFDLLKVYFRFTLINIFSKLMHIWSKFWMRSYCSGEYFFCINIFWVTENLTLFGFCQVICPMRRQNDYNIFFYPTYTLFTLI